LTESHGHELRDADVVVIGGGLAGLNAAAQAARLGRTCVAFTGPVPGGLLLSIESIQDVPGHPDGVPGYDLCPIAQEEAMDAGVACLTDEATALVPEAGPATIPAGTCADAGNASTAAGNASATPCDASTAARWIVRGPSDTVRTRAVILAPGARLRALGVPGEERLAGRGVSHCASCDAPLLRGKPVAVVGGGDAACQEALTLAVHASAVHLLVRGPALRAREAWRARVAAEPRIVVHTRVELEAIEGDSIVQSVRLHGGDTLAVDAVFVYAGLVPNTDFLAGAVPLDATRRVTVDAQLRTPVRGLFAAGTARAGSSGQAAQAAADGLAAAAAAHQYLSDGAWSA
jgi:thioredoxin reductase (NADPH)